MYFRAYRYRSTPATLAMTLSVIRSFHDRAGYRDFVWDPELRRTNQELYDAARFSRSVTLDAAGLARISQGLSDSLIENWVRAAIWFVFDSRFKASAIPDVQVESLRFESDGTGWVPPPDKVDDWTRHGAFLAKSTTSHIRSWLTDSGLEAGPLFPKVTPAGRLRVDGLNRSHLTTTLKDGLKVAGINSSGLTFQSIRTASIEELKRFNVGVFNSMKHAGYSNPAMIRKYTRDIPDRSSLVLAELQQR